MHHDDMMRNTVHAVLYLYPSSSFDKDQLAKSFANAGKSALKLANFAKFENDGS